VLHGKGQMPAWGNDLSDLEIASVVTYIRNSWGNHTGQTVQPGVVGAARDGKTLPGGQKQAASPAPVESSKAAS